MATSSNNVISNIRIFLRDNPSNGVLASVTFTVAGIFDVKGTVRENANGMYVGLPGEYYEVKDKTTKQPTGEKKWDSQVRVTGADEEAMKANAQMVKDTILKAYMEKKTGGKSTASAPNSATKNSSGFTKAARTDDRW